MNGLALELISLLVSLTLVLGAAFVFLRILKRFQPGGGQSAELAFLRAVPIGPRERIVLMRWRDEVLVIGVAPGAVALLTRGPAPPAPEPTVADGQLAVATPTQSLPEAPRTLWSRTTAGNGRGPLTLPRNEFLQALRALTRRRAASGPQPAEPPSNTPS